LDVVVATDVVATDVVATDVVATDVVVVATDVVVCCCFSHCKLLNKDLTFPKL